jgi:hypothetical protein
MGSAWIEIRPLPRRLAEARPAGLPGNRHPRVCAAATVVELFMMFLLVSPELGSRWAGPHDRRPGLEEKINWQGYPQGFGAAPICSPYVSRALRRRFRFNASSIRPQPTEPIDIRRSTAHHGNQNPTDQMQTDPTEGNPRVTASQAWTAVYEHKPDRPTV